MTLHNCTVTIGQYVETQHIQTQYVDKQTVEAQDVEKNASTPQVSYTDLPQENHYADAARWIRKMADTRDFIREANNNMEELGRILSPIFGWQVEGHQIKKALYRN